MYQSPDAIVWNQNSTAFRASDEWQVLARFGYDVTLPEKTFKGPGESFQKPTAKDNEAVPLLAARQLGKGRIAYFGLPSAYHIVGGRTPAYENLFLNRGLKGRPSDGEQHKNLGPETLWTHTVLPSTQAGQ